MTAGPAASLRAPVLGDSSCLGRPARPWLLSLCPRCRGRSLSHPLRPMGTVLSGGAACSVVPTVLQGSLRSGSVAQQLPAPGSEVTAALPGAVAPEPAPAFPGLMCESLRPCHQGLLSPCGIPPSVSGRNSWRPLLSSRGHLTQTRNHLGSRPRDDVTFWGTGRGWEAGKGGGHAEPLLVTGPGICCEGSESILDLKTQYREQMTLELEQFCVALSG